jgi:ethanolamine kinase
LNNASYKLPISVDVTSNLREHQLKEVARILCPTRIGGNEDDNDLVVSPLSGGLSNVLFVVTSRQHDDHHQVLVRIQDASQDASLVNVEEENHVMAWLSQQGKAPTYFGRFENGRVEEFYSDYTPLSSAEMVLYQTQIASLLASIHASVPPESVLPRRNHHHDGKGQCWSTIQKWLDIYKSQTRQEEEEEEEPLDECLDVDYLQRELQWLQGQLTTTSATIEETVNDATTSNAAIQYCRQVVFCHMDAQSLNVLRNDKNDDDNMKLIDYEYASWNPRAADIANTWCEYCDMNNLKANYQQEYPSEQAQEEFLKQYLKHMGDEYYFDKVEDCYPILRLEVNKHALISHLMWTVWSLVQSKLSDIEFDYLQYAKQRMEGYHYFKQRYF